MKRGKVTAMRNDSDLNCIMFRFLRLHGTLKLFNSVTCVSWRNKFRNSNWQLNAGWHDYWRKINKIFRDKEIKIFDAKNKFLLNFLASFKLLSSFESLKNAIFFCVNHNKKSLRRKSSRDEKSSHFCYSKYSWRR